MGAEADLCGSRDIRRRVTDEQTMAPWNAESVCNVYEDTLIGFGEPHVGAVEDCVEFSIQSQQGSDCPLCRYTTVLMFERRDDACSPLAVSDVAGDSRM